jgi:PKD repeat protein
MKKYISVLCVLIIGSFSILSHADEYTARSLSPSDIQRAVDAASPGDTVVLPAGDYSGFNSTVFVPNGVSLRGQGSDRTILRNTSGSKFQLIWNYDDTSSSYKIQISGFKLIGHGKDSGSGIELDNILDFAIFDLEVRDFGGTGVAVYGSCRGVVYQSRFINICPNDLSQSGYGVGVYGDGIWDNPKPPLGTKNAVFVEDCYFSGCKHAIASNNDSHYVFRNNYVEGLTDNRQGVDAHGKQSQYSCGSNTWEIYKNTIVGSGLSTQTDWGIAVRGGSGVIYENTISKCDPGLGTPPKAIAVGIDDHTSYPDPFQVRDLYVWGNTHNGDTIGDIFVADNTSAYVKKDREYFLYKKPGYISYAYPHPLRGVTSPVFASISASPLSGQAPLAVSFKGVASGGVAPYTYSWNFGDGKSSTVQNPTHTFQSAAKFTAILTVRDSQGSSDTESVVITVTSVPTQLSAYGSGSPLSGPAPLYVKFSGEATGGVPPYSFRWNFGDGWNWATQHPSHTYEAEGQYTATLYVTDSQSATAKATVAIRVAASQPPLIAKASASPQSGPPPLNVKFGGGVQGGTPPYSYRWNFGDGGVSSLQNPSHTYSSEANYAAVLTVTDANLISATSPITITVTTAATYKLTLSAKTGAPAPGQGGTTQPGPGIYAYVNGSFARPRAVPYTNYRFSRWTGDVAQTLSLLEQTSVTMDRDRSVSATFCVKCGDVNGDLQITPADAQAAFDIFLGKISQPTLCESENADVNGSGTAFAPSVTPADAQGIFNKYLKKAELQTDCSGMARTATAATISSPLPAQFGTINLAVHQAFVARGADLSVSVLVDSSYPIGAFGFDLAVPPEAVFLRAEWTDFTAGFTQLGAYQVDEGVLRVGGYALQPVYPNASFILVTLTFRALGPLDPSSLFLKTTYDDLHQIQISPSVIQQPPRLKRDPENRPGKKDTLSK